MICLPRDICQILIFLSFVCILAGCNPQKKEDTSSNGKRYSIYVMMKDGKEYLIQTDSITKGHINPEVEGAKVLPPQLFYELIVRDGYYYWLNWKTGRFVKSSVVNKVLTENAFLPIEGFSTIENYNWIDRDSLLIIGYDDKSRKVRYAKIDVAKMTAVQGVMKIAPPSGLFNWMSVGFSKFAENKLLVGYTYHTTNKLQGYATSDTIYTDVLSYPGMQSQKTFRDTRSAYPGGVNSRQPHFFTDEKGDFYFITCPGIALGNNANKPTGIFRIRKGEEGPDPDYFFNISASKIQNHGYGLWYIGDGKAVVRTERKGLFSGMNDHWKVAHFDFYLLDLVSKSTARMDLPLDKGTARQCVLVENDFVYVTINSDQKGSAVWIYNPKTGTLKKGLEFDGDVDYVLRLERLN